MKYLVRTLLLALLLPSPTLLADGNWLENGDFSSGSDHWRGNARTPADFASDNPFDKPDPLLTKGLILPLRGVDWDKIQQDFRGRGTHGVLTITYMVTPDIALSTKEDDYHNVPDQLHYDGWMPFAIPVGEWVVFVADYGSARGTYWHIKPHLEPGKLQTERMKVFGLTPLEDKTITIGFPPGTGKVVLLNISLTDTGGQETSNPLGQ